MSKPHPVKTVSAHRFEPDPQLEAMLRQRDANRTRYEFEHCRNDKARAERYEQLKRKAKQR